jgi:hypothetical protein
MHGLTSSSTTILNHHPQPSSSTIILILHSQAAGAISTPDDGIVAALLKLANEDHSWKVKAHSINGKIIFRREIRTVNFA